MFTETSLTRGFNTYTLLELQRSECVKSSPQETDITLKSIFPTSWICFVYVLAKSCLLGMFFFSSQFVEAAS